MLPPAPAEAPSPAALAAMDDLRAEVAGCARCALAAVRRAPVFGEGPAPAGLLILGEAPGAAEDAAGRPFLGELGALLTRMLAAIGLDRAEVYIANAVKCRAPEGRRPEREEIAACRPLLERQIGIVSPRFILALGELAARSLFSPADEAAFEIAALRGRAHDVGGVSVLVTHHPTILRRDPGAKREAWEDLQLLRRLLDAE